MVVNLIRVFLQSVQTLDSLICLELTCTHSFLIESNEKIVEGSVPTGAILISKGF